MIVFRLCRSAYQHDLSGKGAALTGGRWNNPGIHLLYTCNSRALCTAEIAVHTPLGMLPVDYVMLSLNIPDQHNVSEVSFRQLPMEWDEFPHSSSTRKIGDAFVKNGNSLILKVPSAVVHGEFNYLINPAHKDFQDITISDVRPFRFDQRLFNR